MLETKSVAMHMPPSSSFTGAALSASRRDSVASVGSDAPEDQGLLAVRLNTHRPPQRKKGKRGQACERVTRLCQGSARVVGATLTGGLAGATLGCTSFNPSVVVISSGAGAAAGFAAHMAHDANGPQDSARNRLSHGIRATMGGLLNIAESGVLSAPFGARFATIDVLSQRARDLNLGENETAVLVGLASAAGAVGWTIAIGGAVGALAVATRVLKEVINLPGHYAGSPLRIPTAPLKDFRKGVVFVFSGAGGLLALRNTAALAAGRAGAQHSVAPFGDSLATQAFELSAATQSALLGSTVCAVALALYMEDGGAWKDMPLLQPREFQKWALDPLLQKMQGGIHMATTSPLTSILKIGTPENRLALAGTEMLKLITTPAAFFGFYALLAEHLAKHPVEDEASSTAMPTLLGGGLLFGLYWIPLLMRWVTAQTPEAIDEVNGSTRTIYADVQRSCIIAVAVLTVATAADDGIDEARPDRVMASMWALLACAILLGSVPQALAGAASSKLAPRQALQGFGAAISGAITGALNGGLPTVIAATAAALAAQAAVALHEWFHPADLQQARDQVPTAAVIVDDLEVGPDAGAEVQPDAEMKGQPSPTSEFSAPADPQIPDVDPVEMSIHLPPVGDEHGEIVIERFDNGPRSPSTSRSFVQPQMTPARRRVPSSPARELQ